LNKLYELENVKKSIIKRLEQDYHAFKADQDSYIDYDSLFDNVLLYKKAILNLVSYEEFEKDSPIPIFNQ
jgi:hypothetical protein